VCGWAFAPDVAPEAIARRLAAAGLDAFEPVIGRTGGLTPDSDRPACERVADAIRCNGVACIPSLVPCFHRTTHVTDPDPQHRQWAIDQTVRALDQAAWLGADVLLWQAPRLVCPRTGSPVPYADALVATARALEALAIEAESRNVAIAVEPMGGKFLLSPVECRELIDATACGLVGLYMDTGNVAAFGDPADWIRTMGYRTLGLHVKEPADGCDWPGVAAALCEAGYTGPLIAEVGPGGLDLAAVATRLGELEALLDGPVPPAAAGER